MTTCTVCGFDNEPLPGEPYPSHCEGCGTRISGGEKPFPGREIDPNKETVYSHEGDEKRLVDRPDEPLVVDDELQEKYPHMDLEDVLLVTKAKFHWGRGIGGEPDGYVIAERVTVERVDEPCPTCSNDERRVVYVEGRAGVAGSMSETCTRCETELENQFWS